MVKKLQKFTEQLDKKYYLHNALDGAIKFINFNYSKDIQSTINKLNYFDQQRSLSSKKLFPEVYAGLIV